MLFGSPTLNVPPPIPRETWMTDEFWEKLQTEQRERAWAGHRRHLEALGSPEENLIKAGACFCVAVLLAFVMALFWMSA